MSAVTLVPEMEWAQFQAPQSFVRRYHHRNAVDVPNLPLFQLAGLGDTTTTAVSAGAAIGTTALTAATPAIVAAGLLPLAAIPIVGAAIVALAAIFNALWGAHEARVKGAKTENQAVESALVAFDGSLRAIFDAANSSDPAKNIDAQTAITQCQNLYAQFWQELCSLTRGPGRADTSNCGANCGSGTNMQNPCAGMPGGHKCDKSCTASCCVGCQDIKPTIDQAIAVFSAGGGTVQVCAVGGSSYGVKARGSYSLTYKAPAISSVSSAISSIFGGGAAGGGSLLLPALAIAAIFAFS